MVRALKQLASSSLAAGGLTTTGGRSRERVIVIGLQVALGLVLTFAGALAIGSFLKASNSLGFEPSGLIVVTGVIPEAERPAGTSPPSAACRPGTRRAASARGTNKRAVGPCAQPPGCDQRRRVGQSDPDRWISWRSVRRR